ncbi:MAG: substrate-binding domain-containing protein [Anaerolineae bacterium]|nr:substrate-binding domain-containing protein [Anaerolineae bacterium]
MNVKLKGAAGNGLPDSEIRRPTIGLFLSWIHASYENELMHGVARAAEALGVNLLCFVGGEIHSQTSASVIYKLASVHKLDGLLICGTLGHGVSPELVERFCQQYAPLPIVGVALDIPNVSTVLPDSYVGMREIVLHLIEVHGYRQIAFIRGPMGQLEAEERYKAYVDALTMHNITVNEAFVAVGDYTRESGRVAMRTLLANGMTVRAVVAANDEMALGAQEVLQAQDIRVPEDIAITGFDNIEVTQYVPTPLTTVQQPLDRVGRRAIGALLDLISGSDLPPQLRVPTELVIRRSCGCFPESVEQIQVDVTEITGNMTDLTLLAIPESIPADVWRAFLSDIEGVTDSHFLLACDSELQQAHVITTDLSVFHLEHVTRWYGILARLRRQVVPYLTDRQSLLRAENLLQQAWFLVSETMRRLEGYQRSLLLQQETVLELFARDLLGVNTLDELRLSTVHHFPELGISQCYIALYEQETAPIQEARLLLAYDKGQVEVWDEGAVFPSQQIFPQVVPLDAKRYTAVVMPLFLRDTPLGFVIFVPTSGNGAPFKDSAPFKDGAVYTYLREQISGTIFRIHLLQQQVRARQELERVRYEVQRRAALLEDAAVVSQVASSITELDELLERVVALIAERFSLYYAGIFLVDSARRWAILRAGSGEAGRALLAQGHKLEVAETSMIGACVLLGEARITFDAAQEEVRRQNPFLPDTRSEMALPLRSRGQVIGAMTIQSVVPGAFSHEDITALQAMVDQLGNAIENARLIQEMALNRRELEVASGQYTQEAWRSFAQGRRQVGYRAQYASELADIQPAVDLSPEAQSALQQNSLVLVALPAEAESSTGPNTALGVPIRFRDQVVGVLNLRFESGTVPQETIDMVEQLTERLGVSLENARLLEQTRRNAARERLASQVSGRMRASLDVDEVLKNAAFEIRRAMDLSNVTIRLAPRTEE